MNKCEVILNMWPVVERLGWAVEKYFTLREAGEVYVVLRELRRWFQVEGREFRRMLVKKRTWRWYSRTYARRFSPSIIPRLHNPCLAFYPSFEFCRREKEKTFNDWMLDRLVGRC